MDKSPEMQPEVECKTLKRVEAMGADAVQGFANRIESLDPHQPKEQYDKEADRMKDEFNKSLLDLKPLNEGCSIANGLPEPTDCPVPKMLKALRENSDFKPTESSAEG